MKQKTVYLLVVFVCSLALVGCSNNNSPAAVSQDFWQAMVEGDMEAAKQLATEGSMDGISVSDDRQVTNLQLGDVRQEDGYALIATKFDSGSLDSTVAMSFDTVLEQEHGEWRVNFNRTVESMLGSSFKQLQDALSDSISEAGESIGEAVEEAMTDVAEEMSDVLQDAAEEMQKAADELRDHLDDDKKTDK